METADGAGAAEAGPSRESEAAASIDLEELRSRALRVFGERPIASLIQPRKAIVFVGQVDVAVQAGMDDKTAALAQQAVDILRAGAKQRPSDEQLQALVRCIRFMRPSLFVQDRRIVVPHRDRSHVTITADQLARIEPLLAGIASIGRASEPLGLGTGFLIAPRLLLTNRHVVQALTGKKEEAAPLLPDGLAVARFGLEQDRQPKASRVRIVGMAAYASDPTVDVALLSLAEDGPLPEGLPLQAMAAPARGQSVLVVGYPGDDPNAPAWSKLLFDGQFGVERAAPGDIIDGIGASCFHDCSTLAGSSGSPVFDATSGQVIAVHRAGEFAYRNEAISTQSLHRLPEIAERARCWVVSS